ncbi:hypothetical protein B0H10DRAFT_439901 [Mycena sp. CBHHK59/15]|nr:hypothetical protein B0H10DRAFT_439901 [Mycena sp. CBHHK59/15]
MASRYTITAAIMISPSQVCKHARVFDFFKDATGVCITSVISNTFPSPSTSSLKFTAFSTLNVIPTPPRSLHSSTSPAVNAVFNLSSPSSSAASSPSCFKAGPGNCRGCFVVQPLSSIRSQPQINISMHAPILARRARHGHRHSCAARQTGFLGLDNPHRGLLLCVLEVTASWLNCILLSILLDPRRCKCEPELAHTLHDDAPMNTRNH